VTTDWSTVVLSLGSGVIGSGATLVAQRLQWGRDTRDRAARDQAATAAERRRARIDASSDCWLAWAAGINVINTAWSEPGAPNRIVESAVDVLHRSLTLTTIIGIDIAGPTMAKLQAKLWLYINPVAGLGPPLSEWMGPGDTVQQSLAALLALAVEESSQIPGLLDP
jgi:hypothetical protein